MGLLDRLEQSIERLLEGTTGSLFRQKLQPVEIGKRLERQMLSRQQISVDAKIVPNAYQVRLNPRDYEQFKGFQAGLCREMESWLAGVASHHRLTMLDRISVDIVEDGSVAVRNPVVEAEITDQPRRGTSLNRRNHSSRNPRRERPRPPVPPRTSQETGVINAPTRQSSSGSSDIRILIETGYYGGQEFPIAQGNTTIGRSSDNTIVLDSPDVSRRHARFERSGEQVRIYDLNSTNGTWINGEAVHISDIQPGDQIRLGKQELRIAGSKLNVDERQRWW